MFAPANNWVSATDIAQLVHQAGDEALRFQPFHPASDRPVLQGSFQFNEVRPGLVVHSTHARELHDLQSRAETPQGVSLVIVLGGQIDVSFGTQRLVLQPAAQNTPQSQPGPGCAALVALAETDVFERRSRLGGYSRKVSLSLSPQWLAHSGMGQDSNPFLRQHLSVHHWAPSPRAMLLAEQIIAPSLYAQGLQNLYLESRSIELIMEAFGHLTVNSAPPARPGLRPADQRRMGRVLELLESDPLTTLSVDEMARQVGTNATTLQKQFRALHGCTVFEFLREKRLQNAHALLARDGISIALAAEQAGYSSAANFATAYKRRFGMVPRQARLKV